MTQSGQGPEPQYPAARPAHEGVVLPAEGGVETGPAAGPAGGQPWGGAWGPGGAPQGRPLPPAQPLPPEAVPGGVADMQATQYIAPVPPQNAPPAAGPGPLPGPMPGAMPGAPGSIPGAHPQPGHQPPQGGYGYPPAGPAPWEASPAAPGPSAADLQATQHIPPVAAQGGSDTQFLGTGPLHQQGAPGQPVGASDATQYIAPVPPQTPGERQPPAEFDNLFRSDATQHMPQPPQAQQQPPMARPPRQQQYPQQQFAPHTPPPQPSPFQDAYPQASYQDGYDEAPEPRRKSPVALIAAVVVGCAIVGLGAGALLSGGEDEKEKDKVPGQTVAASSSAPADGSTEKPADPAEPQAKELDKLLADSNNSRDAVIRSVEAIKQCKNLDQAATDLRGAAQQRRGLVTRLQGLRVDKLPQNAALTASLTKAWQASASADDHYAAWAVQMKGKKACKDGKARSTNHAVEAHKKSGEATTAKKEAAGLWNPTAVKYGLTQRTPTQL
ncbi:hypothetical protein J7E93_12225 [Streptomyces sp. ISL-36]|uniref:hypothetical protein n=1 Tax=Streptomyces sp. ISL-36 TaxID=2819182 RepID=UPI001BE5870D|nr:hypothetical protein [Streptomyces sp. ISL-36]MBT2440863.1 hypothetical protein [Streptomyces sp. ISL-36]